MRLRVGIRQLPVGSSTSDCGAVKVFNIDFNGVVTTATGIAEVLGPSGGPVVLLGSKGVNFDCSSWRSYDRGTLVGKDPRLVEVILSELVRVVRTRPNLLIVEHRLGFVMANAGVDQSNVAPQDGVHRVLLLPDDPDASAEALRARLADASGAKVAVIINDSARGVPPRPREPGYRRVEMTFVATASRGSAEPDGAPCRVADGTPSIPSAASTPTTRPPISASATIVTGDVSARPPGVM